MKNNVATPTSDHSTKSRATIFLGMAVLLACIAFFGFDVVADIVGHSLRGAPYATEELVHLIFEMLAVAGLTYAATTLRAYLRLLHSEADRSREALHMLRGNFDEVLRDKFEKWGLTTAERDVTLLTIRGLSIADIAAARNTAQGTIKAQSTSIFRKIGVRSKTELMSVIIDEFLEAAPKTFSADGPEFHRAHQTRSALAVDDVLGALGPDKGRPKNTIFKQMGV